MLLTCFQRRENDARNVFSTQIERCDERLFNKERKKLSTFQASWRWYDECVSPFRCRRDPVEATLFRLAGEATDERMKTMLRRCEIQIGTSLSTVSGEARLGWRENEYGMGSQGVGRVEEQDESGSRRVRTTSTRRRKFSMTLSDGTRICSYFPLKP